MAFRLGALSGEELSWVTVDTTVMEKDVAYPTDAKLLFASLKGLRNLALQHNIPIRQSYIKLGKRAAIMAGRYAHAKQFKRMKRQIRYLSNRLGRVARDIQRKVKDTPGLSELVKMPVRQAFELRREIRTKTNRKIFSLHAPEVECIGKGYRGHKLTGTPNLRIYHDGLKNLVPRLKKAVKRRAAVEPVIGHLKSDGHLGRNFLKGRGGDHINAIMAAVGYNLRLILNWIRLLFAIIQIWLWPRTNPV